jgi:23S rRNA (uracil1939-C5)-methyltransferase
MGRKLRHIEGLRITGFAAGGKSFGSYNDTIVFVPKTAPGDVVDIYVTKRRRGFYEGRVSRLITASPHRIEPFCRHFAHCGGCNWQHIPYPLQCEQKQAQVVEQMAHIGKIEADTVHPIIGARQSCWYRNKLEFTFAERRWFLPEEMADEERQPRGLGYHLPGRFDRILDIETCWLQPEPSNAIRRAVRDYGIKHGLSFHDCRRRRGWLRNLIIRTGADGQVMVIVSLFFEDSEQREALLTFLHREFPGISSLWYVINPKGNDTITDLDVKLWGGTDHLIEQLGELLRLKVGPKSFYQTNSEQAEKLYQVVADFAGLDGTTRVYDLYTGTGAIALTLAPRAHHVVGIENVAPAIGDARENARINSIENVSFVVGDVREVLADRGFVAANPVDVVVVDPPRSGLHPNVVETLADMAVPRLVYVSCNPATQARDLSLLKDIYRVRAMQPVDMFPQTHHVENVALLEKQGE